jgi:hypothetical protein
MKQWGRIMTAQRLAASSTEKWQQMYEACLGVASLLGVSVLLQLLQRLAVCTQSRLSIFFRGC